MFSKVVLQGSFKGASGIFQFIMLLAGVSRYLQIIIGPNDFGSFKVFWSS